MGIGGGVEAAEVAPVPTQQIHGDGGTKQSGQGVSGDGNSFDHDEAVEVAERDHPQDLVPVSWQAVLRTGERFGGDASPYRLSCCIR